MKQPKQEVLEVPEVPEPVEETQELELDEATIQRYTKEVLAGKHGFGEARRQSLGDYYDVVQDRVLAARLRSAR